MEDQLRRLATLSSFNLEYPVHPIRLAEAGFYYEGKGDEVECFACNLKHKELKEGDNPLQMHLFLSPRCTYVKTHPKLQKDIQTETTVNRITPQESPAKNISPPSVSNSSYTVNNSRHSSNYTQTAEAKEPTRYYFTQQEKPHLYPSDNSASNSASHKCNYVRADTTRSEDATTSFTSSRAYYSDHIKLQNTVSSTFNKNIPQTAGISTARPRYPTYAILSVRQATYVHWPKGVRQQPNDLAKAGFFYEGNHDHVRCFFCGGGLKDWEAEDDPWIEHARWFRKCVFVLQCKGEQFVLGVLTGVQNVVKNNTNTYHREPSNGGEHSKINGKFDMNDPAILSVVEMGYKQKIVQKALLRIQNCEETKHLSAETLAQTVWDLEENGQVDE